MLKSISLILLISILFSIITINCSPFKKSPEKLTGKYFIKKSFSDDTSIVLKDTIYVFDHKKKFVKWTYIKCINDTTMFWMVTEYDILYPTLTPLKL